MLEHEINLRCYADYATGGTLNDIFVFPSNCKADIFPLEKVRGGISLKNIRTFLLQKLNINLQTFKP